MKDIQKLRDNRRINIRKVGVKTISYPITVLDREKKVQQTVATVNMYVNLPHRFKGTHMSRFVEILNRFHGEFNLQTFRVILQEMKKRLEAEAAHLEIEFPYFMVEKCVDGDIGTDRYMCRMHGSLQDVDDLVMEIVVPITLSRPKSASGGLPRSMGRWGQAVVAVRFHRFIWIEELISLVEKSLAASDDPPESVENVCRRIGTDLAEHSAISWFKVVVENLAHGYATFASVSEDRR
jgi:GTP cyclohydrolase I